MARSVADHLGLQDEYTILNNKHFIGVHGYVLVYSVASKPSLALVGIIRDKILNHLVSQLQPDVAGPLSISTGLTPIPSPRAQSTFP